MKHIDDIVIFGSLILFLSGLIVVNCHSTATSDNTVETVETTSTVEYTTRGVYNSGNSTIVTEDGNIWGYETSNITGTDVPVKVVINDNGTSEIQDDVIVSVTVNRVVSIMDELEEELVIDGYNTIREDATHIYIEKQ